MQALAMAIFNFFSSIRTILFPPFYRTMHNLIVLSTRIIHNYIVSVNTKLKIN
nr:MAG TPA: hypothetical protein [Caudoviricetes sp.]